MGYYILLSILAGLLAVDDRAGWQSLLAQPIFAGLLAGFLVGEPMTGLAAGLLLEFVWLSILPMRGTRRPDHIAGSVVGSGTAALLIHQTGDPRFVFITAVGVLSGLASGLLAMRLTKPFLELREKRFSRLSLTASDIDTGGLRSMHLANIFEIFIIEAAAVFILLHLFVYLGTALSSSMNQWIIRGAVYWQSIIPVFGAAALIRIYWHKYSIRFLFMSMFLFLIIFQIT